MDRRVVIGSGLALAAVLAGLLWYQLVRQPEADNEATPRPTPSPASSPLASFASSPTPEASPLSESPDTPLTTKGGLVLTPTPEPVPPTAATGPDMGIVVWVSTLVVGVLGTAVTLSRRLT